MCITYLLNHKEPPPPLSPNIGRGAPARSLCQGVMEKCTNATSGGPPVSERCRPLHKCDIRRASGVGKVSACAQMRHQEGLRCRKGVGLCTNATSNPPAVSQRCRPMRATTRPAPISACRGPSGTLLFAGKPKGRRPPEHGSGGCRPLVRVMQSMRGPRRW